LDQSSPVRPNGTAHPVLPESVTAISLSPPDNRDPPVRSFPNLPPSLSRTSVPRSRPLAPTSPRAPTASPNLPLESPGNPLTTSIFFPTGISARPLISLAGVRSPDGFHRQFQRRKVTWTPANSIPRLPMILRTSLTFSLIPVCPRSTPSSSTGSLRPPAKLR
jgi:hypothetical protein